jgi:hypothetical protein
MGSASEIPALIARSRRSWRLRLCWAGSAIAMATGAMLAVAAADESPSVGFPHTATANPDTAIVSVDIWAGIKPTRASEPSARLPTAGNVGPKLFFGYVEFDQDPDAPGGVHGFRPVAELGFSTRNH